METPRPTAITRIAGRLYAFVDYVAAAAFAAMFVLIVVQVFWRYALDNPLPWPEEIARALYVWLVFLGLVTVIRRGTSYRIEYFVDKMPPRMRELAGIGVDLASLAVYVAIITHAWTVLAANRTMTTSIAMPVNVFYLALPIASLLIVPLIAVSLVRKTKHFLSRPTR